MMKMDAARLVMSSTHAARSADGADALAAFLPQEIAKWKELVIGRNDFGKG
jgi:hypothetical protein